LTRRLTVQPIGFFYFAIASGLLRLQRRFQLITDGISFAVRPRRSHRHKEKGKTMCYNCGCKKFDDDHGDPKNITDKTFKQAADAIGQSSDDAKQKVLEGLQARLAKKP
jgi:hypothetical protein